MDTKLRNQRAKRYKEEVIKEQLGIAYGTARAQLYKLMLFSLVQELERDVCYRCNYKIENAEELSLDHIEDWLHNSKTLYWDLSNVTFSHNLCNIRHNRRATKHLDAYANGRAWCGVCKDYLELAEFSVCKSNKSGVKNICKTHAAEKERERKSKLKPKRFCNTCPTPISHRSRGMCKECDIKRRKGLLLLA